MGILQPVFRPLFSPIMRRTFGDGASEGAPAPWTPASLFAASEQGAWYDPSDLSTMFQDLAGTVPAAVDSPVGKRLDKSGNGNHWTAQNTSARPILRLTGGLYSLQWDGVDDSGSTPSIDFTATDKMGVFVGVKSTSNASSIILELSANAASNNGAFAVWRSLATGGDYTPLLRGASGFAQRQSPNYPAVDTSVIAASLDIAGASVADEIKLRLNAADIMTGGASGATTGNLGSWPLYIGGQGASGSFFAGHTYGEIVVGKLATSPEIASTEAYLAAKTGVPLP